MYVSVGKKELCISVLSNLKKNLKNKIFIKKKLYPL